MLDFSIFVDISSYPWEYFILSVFVIFSSSVVDTYLIFINYLLTCQMPHQWLKGLIND